MAALKGPVHVDWKLAGETLRVNISAPAGVHAGFIPKASLQGLEVVVQGSKQHGS